MIRAGYAVLCSGRTVSSRGRVLWMRSIAGFGVAVLWAGAASALSPEPSQRSSQEIVIEGATVIDGNGGSPRRGGTIVVVDGRITAVGGREVAVPAGALRIDARGKYVIPGLMDANVHLVYGFSTEYLVRFEAQFADLIREGAQIALRSGVTTVFDTWGPLAPLTAVRDEIRRGEIDGARIFVAGNIVGLNGPFSTDFYASTASVGRETVSRINAMYEQGAGRALTFMGPDQARAAIRRYLTHDIDFLKYAVSGHSHDQMGVILFSPGVQKIIIDEARARRLTVQAHTTSIESLRMAVEAGVDLIQHCNLTGPELIPDELLARMVERQTPCAMQAYPDRYLRSVLGEHFRARPVADAVPVSIVDEAQRAQFVSMNNQRRLIAAGANVLMETDGGVAYPGDPLLHDVFLQNGYAGILHDIPGFFGEGHVAWFRGARDAGLSPMQALQAATRNVAAAYRKLDQLGTLAPGKIADLVILDADPLADPANYGAVNAVMKEGRLMDLAALPRVRVLTRKP